MKKVRGYKRYFKNIQNSFLKDSRLDLNFLNQEKYFNFQFEDKYGPKVGLKGKGRKFVIENLVQIFNDWDVKLKKMDCDYYLAIWLYDPRLELSEIVCAIDSKIEYYKNEAFLISEKTNVFNPYKFNPFANQLVEFNWKRKVDLESTFEWEIGWPIEGYEREKDYYSDQRFYNKLKKNPFHTAENKDGKIYFQNKGDIWIGNKTHHNKK
jgi:hypothetical protein